MKTNKKLFWVLVILVLGIWGAIAYQVFVAVTESDTDLALDAPRAMERTQDVAGYVYKDDVRDPFHFGAPVGSGSKKNVNSPPPPVWSPPPFRLTGILMTKKKKTAMLEATDGAVYFLREGDTLQGVKVLKIQPHTVRYSYQKMNALWELDSLQQ